MATGAERLFQIFRHHDTIHSWLAGRLLLDVYETTLLGWVISQMEWIAQRTPPSLHRALFETLVPIFAQYPEAAVPIAVREGNKGVTALRLAAVSAWYGATRTLASRPRSSNPVITAAFHLKHSGMRHGGARGRYPQRAAWRPALADRQPGRAGRPSGASGT
jgi:hypothetical protein